jgi:hypothetical protein
MKLRGFLHSRAFWGFLAAVGLMLHLLAAQPLYTTGDRLLAWVLLAMSLGTAFNYFKDSAGKVPLLPLASLQIYVMYGMAQFTQKDILIGAEWYSPPASAIHHTMILIVIGEIGLLLMFKAGRQISQRWKRSWSTIYPSSLERTKSGAAVYGLLGMAWYFVQSTQESLVPIEIRNIMQTVFNPYLALVLVLYWAYHGKGRRFRSLGLILVCVMAFSGLLSGMLEIILVPIYLLILTDWIWGYTLKTKLIAASLLFFVILSPVKYHYRELALDAPPVQSVSTLLYRLSLWKDAAKKTWEDPFAKEKSIEAASSRTSALLSMAQVVDWVPERVPYKRGDGVVTSLFYWVPRIVWRNKPSISDLINNRYALTFGYSTPESIRTSTIGICQPADGYWDFGAWGSIGYMMIYGTLLGLLFGETGKANPVATILVIVFSASFFQNLASLQFLIASLFSLLVGAWISLQGLGIVNLLLRRNSGRPKNPRVRPVLYKEKE